jgi:hypothetical protein
MGGLILTPLTAQNFGSLPNTNPIGAPWEIQSGYMTAAQINSGLFEGQEGFASDMLSSAVSWPNDQYISATLAALAQGSGAATLTLRGAQDSITNPWFGSGQIASAFQSADSFTTVSAAQNGYAMSSINPGPNQFAQITVTAFTLNGSGPNAFIGPAVRMSYGSGGDDIHGATLGYFVYIRDDEAVLELIKLYDVYAGIVVLGTYTYTGSLVGQTIRIAANGTTISVLLGGSTVISVTDAGSASEPALVGGWAGMVSAVSVPPASTGATCGSFLADAIGGSGTSLGFSGINDLVTTWPGSSYKFALDASVNLSFVGTPGGIGLDTTCYILDSSGFVASGGCVPQIGDVFTFAVLGQQLSAYQNGNLILSGTASGRSSGLPGLGAQPRYAAASSVAWSSFVGGAVMGAPTSPGGLLLPFAEVYVPSAGTPVQVSPATLNCNTVYFQALPGNSGKIYIGLSNLNKTTLVGCLRVLVPPPATPPYLDYWETGSKVAYAALDLKTIYIDADDSEDGVLISYLI